MPYKTQIRTFKRMFRKANPDLPKSFEEDNLLLINEDEYSDWTSRLDPYASFEMNERILEDAYPGYPLRLQEPKKPKGPRQSLETYESKKLKGTLCADTIIIVQSHKTFDKRARVLKIIGHPVEYEFGRIQITVPKELIGMKAKVHIEFPNAPEIKERHRRGRHVLDFHQLQGGYFSKKEPKNHSNY